MFIDRKDAGQKLCQALKKYKNKDVLTLAIPRGGVEVGYEVAKYLNADFSLVVTRKLPFPDNPESGFGAIAEDGSVFIFPEYAENLSIETIDQTIEKQRKEVHRRIRVLRDGEPLPKIAGRTLILVDDGIAMGSTMMASIKLCRNLNAAKIIVAVPVAGEDIISRIKNTVDEMIVLESPKYFRAVAQVYENWYDVPDEEVVEIMERKTHD